MPLELRELNFPGVTPSRQKRSRETSAALLRAGAEMLRTHRLEELSIEGLCAKVDATVGAFYSRFDSKDAFFNALLGLAARDGHAMVAGLVQEKRFAELKLDALCDVLVESVIVWMRTHEGAVRAALHRGDAGPAHWSGFKQLGQTMVSLATPLLLRAMGNTRRASKARTIGFGFQIVFGTLVNAVLNDPGPLSLHDRNMAMKLSRCLVLLLRAEMSPAHTTRASGTAGRARTKTRAPPLRSRPS